MSISTAWRMNCACFALSSLVLAAAAVAAVMLLCPVDTVHSRSLQLTMLIVSLLTAVTHLLLIIFMAVTHLLILNPAERNSDSQQTAAKLTYIVHSGP